eukprot:11155-Amphidinium_carterae.1
MTAIYDGSTWKLGSRDMTSRPHAEGLESFPYWRRTVDTPGEVGLTVLRLGRYPSAVSER